MDLTRYSSIAHADHELSNPISTTKADRVLGLIDLGPDDLVLDAGCGKGEMLIRLLERTGARGVGVDMHPGSLAEASRRAAGRVPPASIAWIESRLADYAITPGAFAAALCIGSTHAFGDARATLLALRRAVRPGGTILIGEGYWRREPPEGYLRALDARREEFTDHAGNAELGESLGLITLYTCASSHDEWDHYEGLYARAVERFTVANPDDPDAEAMTDRIRAWKAAYLRWGRDTLGFGLYLFQRP